MPHLQERYVGAPERGAMASHYEQQVGASLLAVAEEQLLDDLRHYGVDPEGMTVDWSQALGEGHCTQAFGGWLEEVSGLTVLDRDGNEVAQGWMDFIHGGTKDDPLFVFWLFLHLNRDGSFVTVKKEPTIPAHVWERLPQRTKELCCREGGYDSRWSDDPRVRAWKRLHSGLHGSKTKY